MIKIDEEDKTTLMLTRGDSTDGYNNKICFTVPYYDEDTGQEEYKYVEITDKISFVVYEKKGYTKKEILRKDDVTITAIPDGIGVIVQK